MRLIYVCGPYRAPTIAGVIANMEAARREALRILAEGHYPVVPHLNTGLMDGAASDDLFLAGAQMLMLQCSEVRALPGWQRSIGSVAEVREALACQIPVRNQFGEEISSEVLAFCAAPGAELAA